MFVLFYFFSKCIIQPIGYKILINLLACLLAALLAAYRMSVHSTTNTTPRPNYAMLGREVLLPCTFIAALPYDTAPNTQFVTDLRNSLREAHHRIRESLQTSARTEKRYFDRRVRYQQFRVDQFVPGGLTRGVQQHRKPCDAAVKYYPQSTFLTFIILGPTKGSGREDKSFTEKSGNQPTDVLQMHCPSSNWCCQSANVIPC